MDVEKEKYSIIDLNGTEVISKTGGERPQYLIDYDIWVIGNSFYNDNMKQLSPENFEVTYFDDGLFIFKDTENNEFGVMNYEGEILYTMYGTDGVEIEISHSDYDVEELFLKVTMSDSVVVVSTLTDDLVYTHDSFVELDVHKNGFFSTLNSDGSRNFKHFRDGRLVFYWDSVDAVHIADYENKIVFAEYSGMYRYYNIINDIQFSTPPEKMNILNS